MNINTINTDIDSLKLEILKDLFNIINISITDKNDLINIEIERDILLEEPFYSYAIDYKKHIKKKYNHIYSSNYYNFIHNNSNTKQKFPSINLLRQILKSNNFKLFPYYKSFGYNDSGKKLVRRYFTIKLLHEENNSENNDKNKDENNIVVFN